MKQVSVVWLLCWYAVCALNIAAVAYMFKLLNRPRFRSEEGDVTTEVGYEEDQSGRILKHDYEMSGEEFNEPHTMLSAAQGSGPM